MELQLFQQMTQKLAQFSKHIKVLQDYIHFKFGADFQDYCYDRGVILKSVESSRMKRGTLPAKRKAKMPNRSSKRLDYKTGRFTGRPKSIKKEPNESSNDEDEDNRMVEIQGDTDDDDESHDVNDDSDYSVSQEEVVYSQLDDSDGDDILENFAVMPEVLIGSKPSSSSKQKYISSGASSLNSQEKQDSKSFETGHVETKKQRCRCVDDANRRSSGGGRGKDAIWIHFQRLEGNTWECKKCGYKSKSPKANRLRKHFSQCCGTLDHNDESSNSKSNTNNDELPCVNLLQADNTGELLTVQQQEFVNSSQPSYVQMI